MRDPVTCWARCLRCRSIWTKMKPRVANRNMPAARKLLPPLPGAPPRLRVATSTIEPTLPSIGMAFIATPAAPSPAWICGGGCRSIWPDGISGSSERDPRSALAGVAIGTGGAGGPPTGRPGGPGGRFCMVVTGVAPLLVRVDSMIGRAADGAYAPLTAAVRLRTTRGEPRARARGLAGIREAR